MRRGKSVVPSLIQDKRKRTQTFEKRRQGLEKKAYELSTLCEVNICIIMFAPDDEIEGANNPIIWPEDPNVANRMISFYQNKSVVDRNCSKNVDISSVYKDGARILGKEVDKLKKLEIEDKYPSWDDLYDSFSFHKLLTLGNELDKVLVVLQSRIDSMKTPQMFPAQLHGLNSFNCLGNEAALALHSSQSMNIVYESCNNFGNEGALVRRNSQTMKIMDEGFKCFANEGALFRHNSQTMKIMDGSLKCFGNEGALVRRNSQTMKIMDGSLKCFGNEGALVRRNSQTMKIMDGSLNCFGNERALVGRNSQTMKIMDGRFNCFGNEEALLHHNSQTMKIMDGSSSCTNFHNYNNNVVPVPAKYNHTIASSSHDLPPLPGFGDNFVQNNNNVVMNQVQTPIHNLCYAPSQSQKPVLMPFPSPSIHAYSQMMHAQIGDAKIDQFGGNIFFY